MFYVDDALWYTLCLVGSWLGIISVTTYVIAAIAQRCALCFPQNLKKKYGAEWALVTGASSGIGRAITEKLAQQEINVVLVALDDPLLGKTLSELRHKYPGQSFRAVGVNLGEEGMRYMQPIIDSTKDIAINLVFNNAGYVHTGFISDTSIDKLRSNMECNAGCTVSITHHFLGKILERGQGGLVTFTSSAAAYLPGPTATMYSPTKAFLTNFATSVAAEVRDAGVDVVVIHPSPVNTNFYKHEGPTLNSLKAAQAAVASPMDIANQIFAAAGRLTVWDHGLLCAAFRVLNKIIDFQLLTEIVVRTAWLNSDHRRLAVASTTRRPKHL
uniref:Putative short-chain dehydrogenase n=1 Tax=Trypanosoma congolense (strain IL3000) TaxID=1068625 RepID=G0UY01_TRYCI|nr:putative short-chain dehydrogenase [Trypanosoma congolense IL3000]